MIRPVIALNCASSITGGIASRRKHYWLSLFLFITIASASMLLPQAVQAQSSPQTTQQVQQKRTPRTLLDFFFGKSRQRAQPQQPGIKQKMQPDSRRVIKKAPQPRRETSVKKVKPQAAPAAILSRDEVAEVVKNPKADKVMVIGDFIGSGLADGLQEAYATNPDIVIINQTNGSSGFVRDDYYDWSANLPAIIEQQKPAIIIMMIGANDRQSITTPQGSYTAGSEGWTKSYEQRVDKLIAIIKDHDIPLIWVGQPSYKSPSLSQLMLSNNALYRKSVEESGGKFTDIWNGFADENGNFTQTGVDINGQTVRLRSNDGINITASAKRKLAFYVEKPLLQLLKPAVLPEPQPLEGLQGTTQPEKIDKKIIRTGPMNITDMDRTEDDVLLGGADAQINTTSSLNIGSRSDAESTAPIGRIDNFIAPR